MSAVVVLGMVLRQTRNSGGKIMEHAPSTTRIATSTFAEMLIKLSSLRKNSRVFPQLCALLLVLQLFVLIPEVRGLKCFCDPRECDFIRPADCPGKGIIIKDPCK